LYLHCLFLIQCFQALRGFSRSKKKSALRLLIVRVT
jgi:hypothetical protein